MSDFALGIPSMVSGVDRFARKQGICGNCALWGEHDENPEHSPGLPFYTMYMTIQARLRQKILTTASSRLVVPLKQHEQIHDLCNPDMIR